MFALGASRIVFKASARDEPRPGASLVVRRAGAQVPRVRLTRRGAGSHPGPPPSLLLMTGGHDVHVRYLNYRRGDIRYRCLRHFARVGNDMAAMVGSRYAHARGVGAVVVTMQFAGGHMEKDVICGMQVDPTKAAGKSDYNGKTYYFCSPACKSKFEANPKLYAR